ncbi:MAG: SDR family NAD(P)-dependent oxidoreductase [Mangrovibacterium sp.]
MRTRKLNKMLMGAATSAVAAAALKMAIRSLNWYNLEDKVVLVTGGSRGLGLILARQLAEKKARVAICSRSREDLDKVTPELSAAARQFMAIDCDITDKGQVDRMITEVEENMGPVDVVINNAGKMSVGPMEAFDEEDYESAMKVYFWGPFHIIRRVLPHMKEKHAGRIVNIVSVGALVSFPHLLPYSVSKFALSGFSEGLTAELDQYNIKVTSVYPGLMTTGSHRNIDVKGKYEKEYGWFSATATNPLISMSAQRAARKIISAIQGGEKTLTLSFSAKLGKLAHALFPDMVISVFDLINRLLPAYRGTGHQPVKGHDITPETAYNDRGREAELSFNQV